MDLNRFLILGVTHEKVTLQEREVFIKTSPEKLLKLLYENKKIRGYIYLPTCLRTELYIELNKYEDLEEIYDNFKEVGLSIRKSGREAIYYFFQLACGFHSVIKGEEQILSQIKNSYFKSQGEKNTSRLLNIIFNRGISLGKDFRNKSKICENGLSIEGLSLNFLEELLKEKLTEKKIMILGIGNLAQGILRILKKNGCKNITITNRTTHTMKELKENYNCEIIDFKDKYIGISESDIIISTTSAPHYIIHTEEFKEFRKDKEYIFLDLAVPRDIEPEIESLANIQLYNIDYIFNLHKDNLEKRESKVKIYDYMIEEKFVEVERNLSYQ